jgi:hypothetical protein
LFLSWFIGVYLGLFVFGAEGEIRTLEASLEDSHVSGYITSAFWSAPAERSDDGALVVG